MHEKLSFLHTFVRKITTTCTTFAPCLEVFVSITRIIKFFRHPRDDSSADDTILSEETTIETIEITSLSNKVTIEKAKQSALRQRTATWMWKATLSDVRKLLLQETDPLKRLELTEVLLPRILKIADQIEDLSEQQATLDITHIFTDVEDQHVI